MQKRNRVFIPSLSINKVEYTLNNKNYKVLRDSKGVIEQLSYSDDGYINTYETITIKVTDDSWLNLLEDLDRKGLITNWFYN